MSWVLVSFWLHTSSPDVVEVLFISPYLHYSAANLHYVTLATLTEHTRKEKANSSLLVTPQRGSILPGLVWLLKDIRCGTE